MYDEDEEIFLYQGTNFSCGGRPTTTTAVSSNIHRWEEEEDKTPPPPEAEAGSQHLPSSALPCVVVEE